MAQFAIGQFTLEPLVNELSDEDNEYLATINFDDLLQDFQQETTSKPQSKRFKAVNESKLDELEDRCYSVATKKNTTWGVKVFQEWHMEVYGTALDMQLVDSVQLAAILRKFYCEATPKATESRSKGLPKQMAEEYHRNSLKNIRGAVNRHLSDMKRDIDIVRDKAFKSTNNTLDGFLKSRTETGKSMQTKHKAIIPDKDLEKISAYFQRSFTSPVVLRHHVWYMIAIQFITRGLEFHHQLQPDSFLFQKDEEGEFFMLTHETKEKTRQGGIHNEGSQMEKKVHATGGDLCPVKTLKWFLQKTDASATSLFNHYNKEAVETDSTWYNAKPLAQRTFGNFMNDISVGANLGNKYTAHCLRATAIQRMNDAGFEARHIMFMSGHKNESSIRSYNRSCSNVQKKNISTALTGVIMGRTASSTCVAPDEATSSAIVPSAATSTAIAPRTATSSAITPIPGQITEPHVQMAGFSSQQFLQTNRQDVQKQNFFAGAVLHGCTFNIQN